MCRWLQAKRRLLGPFLFLFFYFFRERERDRNLVTRQSAIPRNVRALKCDWQCAAEKFNWNTLRDGRRNSIYTNPSVSFFDLFSWKYIIWFLFSYKQQQQLTFTKCINIGNSPCPVTFSLSFNKCVKAVSSHSYIILREIELRALPPWLGDLIELWFLIIHTHALPRKSFIPQ